MTTIYINGQALGEVTFDYYEETPDPSEPLPPLEWSCSFTTEVHEDDFAKLTSLVPDVEPPTLNLCMPWGILGRIEVPGWIGAPESSVEGNTVNVSMGFTPQGKGFRRAVAMAVESAVCTGFANGGVSVAMRAWLHGTTPIVREMGGKLAYGRGCAYRGERKRRKAMRRLLRAAGVTVRQ